MVKYFIFWLKSIVEETPLPPEIDILVIYIKKQKKYAHLEICGYEKFPNEHLVCYRPLEAQFFTHKDIKGISDKIIISRVKYALEESLNDEFILRQLRGRKIYLNSDNRFEYLFTI